MSMGGWLIVAGALLLVVGLLRMGSHQSGGFNLSNFGLNFGGSVTQISKVGDVKGEPAKPARTDWVGLVIAALGLATALVGWLKSGS